MDSIDWKQSGLAKIVPTNETWLQEVLLKARSSRFFAEYFMRDTYDEPFFPQHDQHFVLLDDDTAPYTYTTAFRGFGKTTNIIAKIVQNACYRRFPFVVIASKTLDYAEENVSEVAKQELLTNPFVRGIFGSFKPANYGGTSPAFSRKSWFLCDPRNAQPFVLHVPKGQGQQVNGLIARVRGKMCRPSLIVLEDPEDRTEVNNEALRREYEDWVFGALLPCVSKARPNPSTARWDRGKSPEWYPPWRVIYQDTVKHEASTMAKIPTYPEWIGAIFPKCEQRADGKFYSLIPPVKHIDGKVYGLSDAQVQQEADQAQMRGGTAMERYAMEWMCKTQFADSDGWLRSLFKYYQDGPWHIGESPSIDRFVIVDPARTNKVRSSFSAMLSVGADCEAQRFYFRALLHRRMSVELIAKEAIKFAIAHDTKLVAVETTGGDDLWIGYFQNAACALGVDGYIEFMWLDARQAPRGGEFEPGEDGIKAARASMLLPYYRLGQVFHDETLRNSPLENQELSWPKPARWDALDCASYAPIVMQKLGKYWAPGKNEDDEELKAMIESVRGTEKYKAISRRIHAGEWRQVR